MKPAIDAIGHHRLVAATIVIAALSLSLGLPTPGRTCTLVASPRGSDVYGNGSVRTPFASLEKLDAALAPGQTGCLRAGTYGNVHTLHRLATSGARGARITITSYPGETATVAGWLDLEASETTISHLRIDGSNTFYAERRADTTCRYPVSQGLVIAGHDDILEYDDYFQSVASLRGNGIGIGWWGNADNTVIRFNKIHDVGGCDFYDHLIYLASGRGAQIYDNWMWDDPHGWGIKLDPGPSDAEIWNNVIDAAGSGFSFANSDGEQPTARNQVWGNVVINSTGVDNPDIGWSNPGVLVSSPGLRASSVGNVVFDNDFYGNAGGESEVAGSVRSSELLVTGNTTAPPALVDPAHHDYRPQAETPIRGLWSGQ